MDLETLLPRIEADFREFPAMRLTPKQARRLWAVDDHVIDVLVRGGVLRRHSNGTISLAARSATHTAHSSAPPSHSL